jgi:hypothetical protein
MNPEEEKGYQIKGIGRYHKEGDRKCGKDLRRCKHVK